MVAAEPSPLDRRVAATQQLLDDWKGRPFDWKAKQHCVRMVAEHLRRMGYTPPLAKAGAYSSALGARRAMKRVGVDTLSEAVDLMSFPRIAPAAALVGDIVELPGEDPGALAVALGNGRVLGWHPDADGAVVVQPLEYVAAWRVDPR
ncbi:DUF6950 family protein [Sphingomonas bacterium]|uniref:DUF6950 family protein n=1 Tax=Sphingomonas bacterium TaxID=1895847 RepID=UPI001574FB96|nr:hypothetical protein [Sphingomonas bacterium]